MASKTHIELLSSDGKTFQVELKVARMSSLIKEMLDLGVGEGDEGEEAEPEVVPLQNVTSKVLQKVIEWAVHHKDDPDKSAEEEAKSLDYQISPWDAEFLKVDQNTLFELILAANYLDIKGLFDVTCKTVADSIKGKTPSEIKAQFVKEG